MDDRERLLEMVGKMEGEVVSKHMAKTARDLVGYRPSPIHANAIELMKNQLLILMLRDLGGSKQYTIESIDNETHDCVLSFQKVTLLNGKDAFSFELERKMGRG